MYTTSDQAFSHFTSLSHHEIIHTGAYPELLSLPARTRSGQPESSAAKLLLLTYQEGRPRTGKMVLLIYPAA